MTVDIGITGGPALTYPVTCEGWNLGPVPSGWTVTPNPAPPYMWADAGSTVTVVVTVKAPADAAPGLYSFPLKLKPGKDSDTKTIGEGSGVGLNVTVNAAPLSWYRFPPRYSAPSQHNVVTAPNLRWLVRLGF